MNKKKKIEKNVYSSDFLLSMLFVMDKKKERETKEKKVSFI